MASFFSFCTKTCNTKIFQNVWRKHATKTVIGENVVQLTNNTLLGRIMSYLNVDLDNKSVPSNGSISIINNLMHGKSGTLRNLSTEQLANLLYSANTSFISYSRQNMLKVLGLLDVECSLRINNMDATSIINMLNAYMRVVPNRITEYKFYKYATDNVERCLNEVTQKDLLQLIFYIGLQKNSKKAQTNLRKCLRKIDKSMLHSFTVEDICIICNSTYRTQTKITNRKILEKVKETLNNNLYLLKDPALLITLIKTLKHNRSQDEDILNTIKCTIFFNKTMQYYSFPAMCHILSLYADDLYYDEDLLNLLVDNCIKDLQSTTELKSRTTYLTEQLRPKDITRFLWILSLFSYSNITKETFCNVIVPNIQKRVDAGQYYNRMEELVDSVLYLRMLNYPARELLEQVLSPDVIAHTKVTPSKLRLNLLLTILKYQEQSLFEQRGIKLEHSNYIQSSQIETRTGLQRVYNALKCISSDLEVDLFEINMQIPHLNIMGITAYRKCDNDTTRKSVVHIEVLDETNCVKNKENWPAGYMKLKLQILEQLPVPLIMIPQSDIATLSEEELHSFLKEEFQMIIY